MKNLVSPFLALLFPEKCPACDALSGNVIGLCDRCAVSLYPLGAACEICALPQAGLGTKCLRCRRRPPPFRRLVAPWRYGGELAVAIRRMKYGGPKDGGRLELVRPLGALLAPALVEIAAQNELIVPVPLHPIRLRQRGFAQAQLLATGARRLAQTKLPTVDLAALCRVRRTFDQAGLGQSARKRNVMGAFLVPAAAVTRVRGKKLLLVDDVVTTGATAAACARALLGAGAETVDVLALARAEL